jgi:hypothetical protein
MSCLHIGKFQPKSIYRVRFPAAQSRLPSPLVVHLTAFSPTRRKTR